MKLKQLLLGVGVMLFTAQMAYAQRIITGQVKDNTGETVIGAAVVTKEDRSRGAATDYDGNYTINVPDGTTALIFSYVGLKEQEVALGSSNVINVKMESESTLLDDVVISASKRKEKILDAPASVSVISAERIENSSALTAVDNLKKTPGVDVRANGLVSSSVAIRGFNDVFSGAMLTLVDNRIGGLPSLRANAFQLIPGNTYDIAKMEVVRGPGAALYGPNSADGVLHIITKSPIDQAKFNETTVSLTSGLRSVTDGGENGWPAGSGLEEGQLKSIISPEMRTSFKFSDKLGFKVSGKYMAGEDWEYYDPREPAINDPFFFGTVANGEVWAPRDGDTMRFNRDFKIRNWNLDSRLDFRPIDDMELILSGGVSNTINLDLTGLGAAQTLGWNYYYAQARMRYKNLFMQYFVNSSNSGDQTFLIPQSGALAAGAPPHQFQLLTDQSKLHTFQLQHSSSLLDNGLQLIYGLDVIMTRPSTLGTINGRFEDRDNFEQYGIYVQGDYKINEKLKFVGALRGDYHSMLEEYQISPRAGFTFKPNPKQTLRATYNRAFSTPSSLGTSLDLANGIHPLWNGNTSPFNQNGIAMNIRGIGNYNGYNYNFNESGEILYQNFWDNQQYTLDNTTNNAANFQNILNVITAQLAAQAPPELQAQAGVIATVLFNGFDEAITDVGLVGMDFVEFLDTGNPVSSLWNGNGDLSALTNKKKVESSITQTWELGWKGIISDRVFANVDVYYTKKSNYQSPLVNVSPMVIFDPIGLGGLLGGNNADGLLATNLKNVEALLNVISQGTLTLAGLLEGNDDYLVDADGDAYSELIRLIQGANAQIGVGLVTPENQDGFVKNDMILTYFNLGDVSLWGADFGVNYLVRQNGDIQLGLAYSYLSTDRIDLPGAGNGFIGVNTPRHKGSVSWDHKLTKSGIAYGANLRAQAGFPANSAIYFDENFPGYYSIDTRVSYQPKWSAGTVVSLEVQNFTDLFMDNEYQNFPGTPEMGALGFLKLKHTF